MVASHKKHNRARNERFAVSRFTKRVLEYWRISIVTSGRIESLAEGRKSAWIELPYEALLEGMVAESIVTSLAAKKKRDDRRASPESNSQRVLISPLRISESRRSHRFEVLDLVLIPARLGADGSLAPLPGHLPWIPREHLEPSNSDRLPTISTVARVDKFFHAYPLADSCSFEEYWKFCLRFFRYCSGERLSSFTLPGYRNSKTAMIRGYQDQHGSFGARLRVLDEVLSGERNPGLLPTLCAEKQSTRKTYARSNVALSAHGRGHLGHFSPAFSLAPTQRTAVHRFLETPEGEVFCVNGPPGTGKTTVLQSFIASRWVQAAVLQWEYPPVQLVCGATNQSVLNVIDCLESNVQSEGPLAGRWLPQVHSYGTFCTSFSKSEAAQAYQLEQANGSGFSESMEDFDYLRNAQRHFLSRFEAVFKKEVSLEQAVKYLHRRLEAESVALGKAITSKLEVSLTDLVLRRPLDADGRRERLQRLASLDTSFRHTCFLYATHYWEGRWLLAVGGELERRQQRGDARRRLRPAPEDWGLRAMVTPAFVSTLSMACRFFACRENLSAPSIDVLYFDEAGQVTPEQGAPIAALAKKMVVIGDTAQLKPYTVIPPNLDEAALQSAKLVTGKQQSGLGALVRAGISASHSNLMQLAVTSCRREDGQIVGASLEEHRRSVPEIVSFCNELSYRGRLLPLRPPLNSRVLPAFGFVEAQGKSLRVGQSRSNVAEARTIARFLRTREAALCAYYSGLPLDQIVAVLTPFTAQVRELEQLLRKDYPELVIGTVQSLQGAERPVVCFSAAYDAEFTGTYVFNADPRILNVAVSRAKDSFIAFGNRKVFQAGEQETRTPAVLLGDYLFSSAANVLQVAEERAGSGIESLGERTRLSTLAQHREVLASAFELARHELLIASPTISIHAIEADDLPALVRSATTRGVRVVIFTDSAMDSSNGEVKPTAVAGRDALVAAGAELLIADSFHNKSLAVDRKLLVEGSFNWLSAVRTEGSVYQKLETSWMLQGAAVAGDIDALRSELFSRTRSKYCGSN